MPSERPGAGDPIRLLRDQASALEAVKQRPGLRVVPDPERSTDRPAARAGMLCQVAQRPAPQQRWQPRWAAIIEIMATDGRSANYELPNNG